MLTFLNLIESGGIWEAVSKTTNPVTLVAFALAIVLSVMLAWLKMQAWLKSKPRNIPTAFWLVLTLLVLIGVAAALCQKPNDGIYHVRVTIRDPQGIPVVDPLGQNSEDLKVWANVNAAPQPWPGGWQFDIPTAIKPPDGKLIITATKESEFLKGEAELLLKDNFNPPAVLLTLKRDDSAKVRGQIVDCHGKAIAGARVWVVGYGSEGITTQAEGNFELPAHKAINQQVELHAEKPNYKPVNQFHPAGDEPVTLILPR